MGRKGERNKRRVKSEIKEIELTSAKKQGIYNERHRNEVGHSK